MEKTILLNKDVAFANVDGTRVVKATCKDGKRVIGTVIFDLLAMERK